MGWSPGTHLLLEETLICPKTAELSLNFVVDKSHGVGRGGPWCAEKTSFGYTCILFQSGSSKKVAIQHVCVFVCAKLP